MRLSWGIRCPHRMSQEVCLILHAEKIHIFNIALQNQLNVLERDEIEPQNNLTAPYLDMKFHFISTVVSKQNI